MPSDGSYSTLSPVVYGDIEDIPVVYGDIGDIPVVYGDIALSINTIQQYNAMMFLFRAICRGYETKSTSVH